MLRHSGGNRRIVFVPATPVNTRSSKSNRVRISLMDSSNSTPIINPPQSAILGIHATKERPVVENGQIVIRPMNYLALSYDHRLIDGREAVQTLRTIKETLEDPARLLLDL